MTNNIPVVILCGGRGTRLQEETEVRPKPLVEIGGRPILWHIMKHYSAHGFKEFVLCLGYKKEMIKDYFLNYHYRNTDLTVKLADSSSVKIHRKVSHSEDWTVTLADTGDDAMTGARIAKIKPYISSDTFMLTYGDGVCDVDLKALVEFHKKQGKIATVTAVHPPSRFGELHIGADGTAGFREKPPEQGSFINGGFFVLNKKVFSYLDTEDDCVFERKPLEKLSKESQLTARHHKGFWQCMDTIRDKEHLNELWNSGKAPWKTWD